MLSALYPVEEHVNRVLNYEKFENELDFTGISSVLILLNRVENKYVPYTSQKYVMSNQSIYSSLKEIRDLIIHGSRISIGYLVMVLNSPNSSVHTDVIVSVKIGMEKKI